MMVLQSRWPSVVTTASCSFPKPSFCHSLAPGSPVLPRAGLSGSGWKWAHASSPLQGHQAEIAAKEVSISTRPKVVEAGAEERKWQAYMELTGLVKLCDLVHGLCTYLAAEQLFARLCAATRASGLPEVRTELGAPRPAWA